MPTVTTYRCCGCHQEKASDEFRPYPQRPLGRDNYCRDCRRRLNREYYAANHVAQLERAKTYRDENRDAVNERNRNRQHARPDVHRERQRAANARIRQQVFEHYGTRCACCGEAEPDFLTIDHVNGGGCKHRREIHATGTFYRWLLRNGFPDGFQTLCYNCNCAKGKLGVCPHQVTK